MWSGPRTYILIFLKMSGTVVTRAGEGVYTTRVSTCMVAADVTFRCRACGPLPLTSFDPSVLKRGRSGDCRACRKRANALHYATNRWRLRGAVAPGVCGPETDPKALVADVLSRAGRRCAITGISNKSLVVVKLADGGLVPILRKLFMCGVAPGGVLAPQSPSAPAPVASNAVDGCDGPPPPPEAQPPSGDAPPPPEDAPLPAPEPAPPLETVPALEPAAPPAAVAAARSSLAELLKAKTVVGLVTKAGR